MNIELERAMTFHRQGRIGQAEEAYTKALAEDFDNALTLYLLGTVFFQQKRFGLAATLLSRAIMIKPDYFEAWNNLGNCYKSVNKDADAKACWDKCLKFEGRHQLEYADIWNNLATLHIAVALS